MIHYGGRLFRPVATKGRSDTSTETVFKYEQKFNLLTGSYAGGNIRYGHIIGIVDERGRIDMRYHHMNIDGVLMTGVCKSTPKVLESGKIRLYERWQWTCGDCSSGKSTLEEL